MAEINDAYEIFKQNLIDAGYKEKETNECLSCFKKNEKIKIKIMLKGHRKKLLESLHTIQKELDCLDYLIYKINKE